MTELDETYRHSEEVIERYIIDQIEANSQFSIRNSSTTKKIARELAWECRGSKHIARLRLNTIANAKPYLQDREIDDNWFKFWCGKWSHDQIYGRAFEGIKQDLETNDTARKFLFWVLNEGINGKDALLDALKSSSPPTADWSNPANLEEQAKMLSIACGGFIAISEWNCVHTVYMHPDIRNFLLRDERWRELCGTSGASLTYGQVHASLAASCATYIMTAYHELDGMPCSDDESMDRHMQKWPMLEYAGNNVARHIREAGMNLAIHWIVISKLIQGDSYSFGHAKCILQIQSASRNPKHRQGWSQRFPERVLPLVYAASEGLYFVVRNLIEVGANVRLDDSGIDGRTALAAAATNGHPHIAKYLIDIGANFHARDPMMDTPLALAAAQGHQEVVEVLLQAGANPNLAALDGTTAAIIAASNGHARIVERLLLHEVDRIVPGAADKSGETIMSHIVRFSDQSFEMVNLLRRYGPRLQTALARLPCKAALNRAILSTALTNPLRQIEAFQNPEQFLIDNDSITLVAYMPAEFRRQYQICESIGFGAFSRCFRAIDRLTGRTCAVKASRVGRTTGKNQWVRDNRYRLEKEELNFLKKFNHRNVISLQNHIDAQQYVFTIFELADRDLFDHFQKVRMSEDQIREMMKQLLEGVKYLHENNVIHCDLKPANILVFENGAAFKLTDLGNSQHVISGTGDQKLIPHCSGTRCYASPEANKSFEKRRAGLKALPIRGPPCDIYSLGCILFEAFARKYEWDQLESKYPRALNSNQDKIDAWEDALCRLDRLEETRDDTKFQYWEHLPVRVENLVRVMLKDKVEERATIKKCERSLWMRTNSSDRMTKEEHDELSGYLPHSDMPEDYHEKWNIQVGCMKAFDLKEELFLYMPEMPRYYFEQMVLGMYDPLQWGWSIQAVWNGYPRMCKNEPETEHPFGLNECKWCGWLLTPDLRAAMIAGKIQDQHDILVLEQLLKEKVAKEEEERQRQLAHEAEKMEAAKYENLRERMIAVALEETSKDKEKLEQEELQVCAMEEKIDQEATAFAMFTDMQERETWETKTERKRSRSQEKRSRSQGGKDTHEKKDRKGKARKKNQQARKEQHKEGAQGGIRKRWNELPHTE